MISPTTETENMETSYGAEEAVLSNDLVNDVGIEHMIDVVFNGSQRYHWRIQFIGD